MPPAGALKDQDQRRSASKTSENKEEWLTNWLLQRQPQVTPPPPGAPNGSTPNMVNLKNKPTKEKEQRRVAYQLAPTKKTPSNNASRGLKKA